MAFFNPFRRSYIENPYPALARLRAEEPVHQSRELEAWVVTSYEAAIEVLRDEGRFSSDLSRASGRLGTQVAAQREASVLGTAARMVSSDPPVHTRLRRIVSRSFTPRFVEGLRGFVEAEATRLLETASPDEPFDLLTQFAEPLPQAVIGEQLGAPAEEREEVMSWSDAVMRSTVRLDLSGEERASAQAAREQLATYLDGLATRTDVDKDALMVKLARPNEDGERLETEDLLELAIDLALAGNDTTANMIGNGALALVQHADAEAALRADAGLLDGAIEEMMRWDPPTQAVLRIAADDTTLMRRRIGKGDAVLVMLAGANRDPGQFEDPERFDIAREPNRHLALGMGIHHCLGAPLARLQAVTAFRQLLERFGSLELTTTDPLPRSDDWMMRSARRIPLDTSKLR
jgi:cytochrome P450